MLVACVKFEQYYLPFSLWFFFMQATGLLCEKVLQTHGSLITGPGVGWLRITAPCLLNFMWKRTGTGRRWHGTGTAWWLNAMTPTLSTNDDVNLRVPLLLPREQSKALFARSSAVEQDCLPLSLPPALLPAPRKHQYLILMALALCPSWRVVGCLTAAEQSAVFFWGRSGHFHTWRFEWELYRK